MSTTETPSCQPHSGQLSPRCKNGELTRRKFLGISGLGAASAVLAGTVPGLVPRSVQAACPDGNHVVLASRTGYHSQASLDAFSENSGTFVYVDSLNSNAEILPTLRSGEGAWDVFVCSHRDVSSFAEQGLIQPIDLSRLPNYTNESIEPVFTAAGMVNDIPYATPKSWGTGGFVIDTTKLMDEKPGSWRNFWDLARSDFSGHTVLQDDPLSIIGNALKYFGYSFNSVDHAELADAERLLMEVKPHLLSVARYFRNDFFSGEAWMATCKTNDASLLGVDFPSLEYIVGSEGGEIWSEHYVIRGRSRNLDNSYALINFLLDPQIIAQDMQLHGNAVADTRARDLLALELQESPFLYPARSVLDTLEFSEASVLTDPYRMEIMDRFMLA